MIGTSGHRGIISSFLSPLFGGFAFETQAVIEKTAWWFHFIGILLFMNYLPYSKHFHIILAFPNTWYSRLQPAGEFPSNASVTTEVKLMMDPAASPPEGYEPPSSFGVRDVGDLSWKNLMDAYTCTECGRCTSVCPANITGKKLSPRKIMMDTRDRLEEVGKNIDAKQIEKNTEKDLHTYITAEELWACTTCNACVEACPVNISPVEIIMGMRQYLVMEKSEAPAELNMMLTNIENNGAPWQFSPTDRGNWAKEI
jgi:heterodisulfide reductase subunit C